MSEVGSHLDTHTHKKVHVHGGIYMVNASTDTKSHKPQFTITKNAKHHRQAGVTRVLQEGQYVTLCVWFNVVLGIAWLSNVEMSIQSFINPRCACAARVTVLGLSFCPSVTTFSVFCHYAQQGGQKAILTGSVPH